MGARYLLIEFDDETQATRLREQIDKATRGGKRFRVVGLFAKPTKYCQCDPRTHVTTKTHTAPIKRGRKYGWWVCLNCRRPTPSISGLVNLLKPRDIIEPPTWEVPINYRGGPGFTSQHHIPNLSGESLGPAGVEFWNTRGE